MNRGNGKVKLDRGALREELGIGQRGKYPAMPADGNQKNQWNAATDRLEKERDRLTAIGFLHPYEVKFINDLIERKRDGVTYFETLRDKGIKPSDLARG